MKFEGGQSFKRPKLQPLLARPSRIWTLQTVSSQLGAFFEEMNPGGIFEELPKSAY